MSIIIEKPVFSSLTDSSLVEWTRQALPGDHRAYRELILRHQSLVLTNCRCLTGLDHDSEDLAQEVFIKAYFGLGRFEERAQFKTWVQRIKVNHCLNHIRSQKGRSFSSIEAEDEDQESLRSSIPREALTRDSHEAAIEAKSDVDRALRALPDDYRIPLILCDLDGYSYQEAADELGIGMSALKMRVKRGRNFFRVAYRSLVEDMAGS